MFGSLKNRVSLWNAECLEDCVHGTRRLCGGFFWETIRIPFKVCLVYNCHWALHLHSSFDDPQCQQGHQKSKTVHCIFSVNSFHEYNHAQHAFLDFGMYSQGDDWHVFQTLSQRLLVWVLSSDITITSIFLLIGMHRVTSDKAFLHLSDTIFQPVLFFFFLRPNSQWWESYIEQYYGLTKSLLKSNSWKEVAAAVQDSRKWHQRSTSWGRERVKRDLRNCITIS